MRRMIRSVVEPLGGLPVRARRAARRPGGTARPTRTVTWPPGCGSFWPFGQTPFEPEIPIGTIGAPGPQGEQRDAVAGLLERAVGAARALREDEQDVALVEDPLGEPERLDVGGAAVDRDGRRRWPPSSRRSASRTAPSCRASGSAGRAAGSATTPMTGRRGSRRGWRRGSAGPRCGISSSAPSIETRVIARPKIRPPSVSRRMSGVIELSSGRSRAGRGRPVARWGLCGHRVPLAVRLRGAPRLRRRGSRRRPRRPCPRSGCRRSR